MSSRLRESDDRGGRKGGGYWSGVEKKQRSSEAAVGEVRHILRVGVPWNFPMPSFKDRSVYFACALFSLRFAAKVVAPF